MAELKGSLDSASLQPLVRLVADLRSTGGLQLSNGSRSGELFFDQGQLVGASIEDERGGPALEALVVALADSGTQFVFHDAPPQRDDIRLGGEEAAAHVADLVAGRRGLAASVPSLAGVPRLVNRNNNHPGPIEHLLLDRGAVQLLIAVDGRRTVAEVIGGRRLVPALRNLARLVELGLLRVDPPAQQPATAPPAARADARSAHREPVPRSETPPAAPRGRARRDREPQAGASPAPAGPRPGAPPPNRGAAIREPASGELPAGSPRELNGSPFRGPVAGPTRPAATGIPAAEASTAPAFPSAATAGTAPVRTGVTPAAAPAERREEPGGVAALERPGQAPGAGLQKGLLVVGLLAVAVAVVVGGVLRARPGEEQPAAPPAPVVATTAPESTAGQPPTVAPTPAPGPWPAAQPPQPTPLPAAGQPTPPVSTPAVTLEARFTSAQPDWPDVPGRAWWADGAYRLAVRQPGHFVAVGAPVRGQLRDVVVSATFRKVAGPAGGGYGLIVRDQGPGPRDGDNQNGHFYVLEASDRGEIGIWRRDGDRWVDLLPWTPSAAVRQGTAANELTARAVGERLGFLANGTEVASLTDATLTAGGVGAFAGGDFSEVALDAFSVTAPR